MRSPHWPSCSSQATSLLLEVVCCGHQLLPEDLPHWTLHGYLCTILCYLFFPTQSSLPDGSARNCCTHRRKVWFLCLDDRLLSCARAGSRTSPTDASTSEKSPGWMSSVSQSADTGIDAKTIAARKPVLKSIVRLSVPGIWTHSMRRWTYGT